ncbi:GNAT family N-acetyltransferase [Caldibacillus debilis]|uniref:N-acetyltransferase domain-containing protein n=1 Tax=Caldibacillus debilis TaxID=301148 RepID=A0A150LD95_9BACI|nr:GNAT family N-acetyltransferase [Caldibacillus debilis]KYD10308.1 hypothetical protein B4135_3483 [Caldibacillus debilis]
MTIRRANPSDAKGIARVHVDSWRTTYAGIVPDGYLQRLSYESREKLWQAEIARSAVFVAENEQAQIIGFASGGKERTGKYPGYEGELYAIYLLKEHQRKGIGKKLVRAVAEDLLRQGFSSMTVAVLKENPSRFFYESIGGIRIGAEEIEIGGKKLEEWIYGWKDLRSFLAALAEDSS